MKKVKRYNEEGYVTADDSNAGMKEAYDNAQAESRGEEILKGMRDEETAPVSRAKPRMVSKAAPSKPKSTQSGASAPTIGASGTYGGGLGRRSHPEYPEDASKAMADMKQKSSPDVTKMSLSERIKASRESARSGSGKTDTRSVSERLRSAFGMAKGGSASSRADGIATKGKTRGKMC